MKKLFFLTFVIPFLGFSQQLFWYDVFLEVESENVSAVATLVNDFYSTIEKPSDLSVSFSRIPKK